MGEPREHRVVLEERVVGIRGVDHLPGDDLEAQVELLAQLVLPLVDEHARAVVVLRRDAAVMRDVGQAMTAEVRPVCPRREEPFHRPYLREQV